MNEHDTPELPALGLEPDDLDGHTIEELTEYLENGRTPADRSIDESPGCRIALDALARLRALTPELLAADTAAEPATEESWVQGILAGISLDARAGRRIPIPHAAPDADLGITEGAVRGAIRAAEIDVPGVVVGRCRLDGDVTTPGEPIRVSVDVSVPYGDPIPELVNRLRGEIARRLESHAIIDIDGIDITVRDIQSRTDQTEEGDR